MQWKMWTKKRKRFWSERDGVSCLTLSSKAFCFLLTSLSPSSLRQTNSYWSRRRRAEWAGKTNRPTHSDAGRMKAVACTWKFDGDGWSAWDNAGRHYRRRSTRVRNMQIIVAKRWRRRGGRRRKQMKDGPFKATRLHKVEANVWVQQLKCPVCNTQLDILIYKFYIGRSWLVFIYIQ